MKTAPFFPHYTPQRKDWSFDTKIKFYSVYIKSNPLYPLHTSSENNFKVPMQWNIYYL